MYLDFSETQALAAFLLCHEQAFRYFGGVPEEILYDRTKRWPALAGQPAGERPEHDSVTGRPTRLSMPTLEDADLMSEGEKLRLVVGVTPLVLKRSSRKPRQA